MIGTTLDERYAIVRLVGKGGMGAVYEARNIRTNRKVAVKVISGATDAEHVSRFQREASIVGAIESQHITLVYDTGYDRALRLPYIAMELLDGEDTAALLDRLGPLSVDLALRIVYQACLGLGRAHQAGVVHRDIKAANLFLHRREGHERIVKILDFGIARMSGSEGPTNHALTAAGTLLGSPLYMSPEQAKGGHVDARSDVWSLGITLYEMLTGATPFVDIQQLGALIVAICTQPIGPITQKMPSVPPEVAAIVQRALTIDPAGRFSSAIEMGEAIRMLLPYGSAIDDSMLRPLGASSGVMPALAPHARPPMPSQPLQPSQPMMATPGYSPHASSPALHQSAPALHPSAPAFPAPLGQSSVAAGGPVAHAQSGVVPPLVHGTTGIDASQAASRSSRSLMGPVIAAVVVVAVLGVGAGVLLGRSGASDEPAQAPSQTQAAAPSTPTPTPTPTVAPDSTPLASAAPAVASAAPSTPQPSKTIAKPIGKRPNKDEETSRK